MTSIQRTNSPFKRKRRSAKQRAWFVRRNRHGRCSIGLVSPNEDRSHASSHSHRKPTTSARIRHRGCAAQAGPQAAAGSRMPAGALSSHHQCAPDTSPLSIPCFSPLFSPVNRTPPSIHHRPWPRSRVRMRCISTGPEVIDGSSRKIAESIIPES